MNYLLVGLGNPGEKFAKTRHNVGRFILTELFDSFWRDNQSQTWQKKSHWSATTATVKLSAGELILILPDTFMNLSGKSVVSALKKDGADKLVVIHDDLDLPLGTIKISFGRGAGGHNGVQSIIDTLGTKEFIRLRVGIGPARGLEPASFWSGLWRRKQTAGADFVLKSFTSAEQAEIEKIIPIAGQIVTTIVGEGLTSALNQFN